MGKAPAGGPARVHVRHQWPPRLEPPVQGAGCSMQPWEYGSLPKAWLPMLRRMDEVWAYSRSVRDSYLEAGVPPERVHVIPLGVDPEVFRPGLDPLPLPPGPSIRFLFVGGTIFRKGIDLLLAAFARAFQPTDDVGLVIKDMGSQSFYRGQTAEASVAGLCTARLSRRVHRPQPERERACPTLRRLRLPGAPVPGRGLRLAGRRGDGLRPAGDRHRRGAGRRLRHR